MYMYTHTYIHNYIHTYMHAYIHTYMHACVHTYMHTYMYAYRWVGSRATASLDPPASLIRLRIILSLDSLLTSNERLSCVRLACA